MLLEDKLRKSFHQSTNCGGHTEYIKTDSHTQSEQADMSNS